MTGSTNPPDGSHRDAVSPVERWKTARLSDLVTHLETRHHAYTRGQMVKLSTLLEKAIQEVGASRPHLFDLQIHLQNLRRDLATHMLEQEHNLFAGIRAMELGGPVPKALENMRGLLETTRREYESIQELFLHLDDRDAIDLSQETRSQARVAFQQALKELEDDLHLHMYLETGVLFPRVLAEAEARRKTHPPD